MNWKIILKKKIYIPALIILAVGGLYYRNYKAAHQPPQYETAAVTKGNVEQTVEATGKIESVNDLALRFEVPGTLSFLSVKEGQTVKAGTLLANLRLSELNAAVAQANANLQQKLAGATDPDKVFYQAAINSAKATLNQSKIDADNAVSAAQSAVDTAQNNLKSADGGETSQIVTQAYQNGVTTLQATLSKLDDALTQADNILGIDNTFANDSFKINLSNLDATKMSTANSLYVLAKQAKLKARSLITPLTSLSSHTDVDAALAEAGLALAKMQEVLTSVSDVLRATLPTGNLTQALLDAKKTTIESTRTTITTQSTTVTTQTQSISDAKNSLSTYTISLNKAQRDFSTAQSNAINSVTIKEALYNQAVANYESKNNPPREVDVASYRAALAQAAASRDKAVIRAPIDGLITRVSKKIGESVSSADPVIEMLAPSFEVKVDIPETDVSKLSLGDSADITLDAFGEDTKFTGTVAAIDPGSTNVQDVVYYTVTVTLGTTDKPIKSGMTANLTIKTDARQSVLFVSQRAVRTRDDGTKYVRVLDDNKKEAKEVVIKLGLKGNEGKTEITDGLKEGQTVIVSEKK